MRCCLVCCSSPGEVCLLSLTGIQLGTNTTLWPYSALLGLSLSLLSFDECESGRFLRMFLGPINVRANRKDVQLKGKEEYNTVRDKTAYLFLCFPSLLLVLRSYVWGGCLPVLPVQLYQAWLLYLYTRLALRENILRVNGSDIRPWWIKHHYCAMVMALIGLTWSIERGPDCAQKQIGLQLFLKWAIMQGVAMILQTLNLSPIWALMAAFEDPLPVPSSLEGAFVKGICSISWMSNNTTKLFGSESDNEAQRRHNVELVQMQESSSIRKEQARRAFEEQIQAKRQTEKERAEIERETVRVKAIAEAEGRAHEAKLTEDHNRRMLLEKINVERDKWLAAINTTFSHIEGLYLVYSLALLQ